MAGKIERDLEDRERWLQVLNGVERRLGRHTTLVKSPLDIPGAVEPLHMPPKWEP